MHSVQRKSKSLVSLRDPETHIHGFKQEGGCLKKGLWREKAATLLQLSLELSCFNCCKPCTNRTFLRWLVFFVYYSNVIVVNCTDLTCVTMQSFKIVFSSGKCQNYSHDTSKVD